MRKRDLFGDLLPDALWDAIMRENEAQRVARPPKPPSEQPTISASLQTRRSSGTAHIARRKARTLLREKLRRGPKPEAEIAQALNAAEIDRRDVLAACDDLGVLSCRGQWRLP
jgi:hypothetical protein